MLQKRNLTLSECSFTSIKNIYSITDIELLKSPICFISVYLMSKSKNMARQTKKNNIIYMLLCLPSEMHQEEYEIPKLAGSLWEAVYGCPFQLISHSGG